MASPPEDPPRTPRIEDFTQGPTFELADWEWLWKGNHEFPLESHRPFFGRIVVFLKRLARPLVRAPQSDLWDRQQTFNLVLISHLQELRELFVLRRNFEELGRELQQVQTEVLADLRAIQRDFQRDVADLSERLDHLELFKRGGLEEVNRHHDALFARLDQKLDRVRRDSRELRKRIEELPR